MMKQVIQKKVILSILGALLLSLVISWLVPWILPMGKAFNSWLATLILSLLITGTLAIVWHGAGEGNRLLWMMLLAFLLRILLGIFLTWALPRFGYTEQVQQAGYYYADAFTRDGQAWHLAGSGLSLWRVFNTDIMSDQYGGLLFLSGLIYRLFSPDAHRPYLMILQSAGAGALGIPFLISAIQKKFSNQAAVIAGWILCLYPDSLLLGASQMREPYLISLFAVSFWAVVRLVEQKVEWKSLLGLALGLTGLFLISYRVAFPALGALLVWVWVEQNKVLSKKWMRIAGWIAVILLMLIMIFLSWRWLRSVFDWDIYMAIRGSGLIDKLFKEIPEWIQIPFLTIYGFFQPVLPAAIVDPAPWVWQGTAIMRALGWYAILPLLLYGAFGVWRVVDKNQRKLLVWAFLVVGGWTLLSSLRAGGDQWDNPRYRTIFLPWIAMLAAWAIIWAKTRKDRWLMRWIIIEGIFLGFFGSWYASRYFGRFGRLPFWTMIMWIVGLSLLVLVGGWVWDRIRPKA